MNDKEEERETVPEGYEIHYFCGWKPYLVKKMPEHDGIVMYDMRDTEPWLFEEF